MRSQTEATSSLESVDGSEYTIDKWTNPDQDTMGAKKDLVGIVGTYGRKHPWSKCSIFIYLHVGYKGGGGLIATLRRVDPS